MTPGTDIVTAIVASPRAPGRFTVLVDDRALATLDLDAIERLGLAVGVSVADRRDAISSEEAALRTYDRAVNMLAARPRSSRDLARQLVRKGEPADLAQTAVERLRQAGFLDDEQFARHFVRSKSVGGGLAKRRLQQELGRQGVERGVADAAIVDVFADEAIDELAMAEAAAARRVRSLRDLDATVRRRRLYQFLARRGYGPDVISTVLARMRASP